MALGPFSQISSASLENSLMASSTDKERNGLLSTDFREGIKMGKEFKEIY